LWSVGSGWAFSNFRWVLLSRFHPRGFPSVVRGSRHYFRSFRPVSPDPRARSARNPSPSRRESTPWPPPSCARLLQHHPTSLSDLSIERRTTFLSSFPIRFPSVRAFTSRCSTLRRPCDWLGSSPEPYTLVCILPLSTLAQQCCLAAIHLTSRPEGLDLIPGFPTLSTCIGPLLPSLGPCLLRPGGLHSVYRFFRTA